MSDDTALDLAVFYRHDDVLKLLGDMPISAPPPTDDESYNSDEEDGHWEEIKTLSHKGSTIRAEDDGLESGQGGNSQRGSKRKTKSIGGIVEHQCIFSVSAGQFSLQVYELHHIILCSIASCSIASATT
ncbi:hypothetical protein V498_02173 [Pseudogymnoascus sp. VKM F-4517 (FW-2822)]|nr:hypothetical protein V498_02173 [Pseudogymnoascus sp. VKM F-4517 (FW-2822)]